MQPLTQSDRDDRLESLRNMLAASEREGAGYADRVKAIKDEIERLEAE